MFTHQCVLSLRPGEAKALLPKYGHFRDLHFVRSLMEAKGHLLLCMAQINQRNCPTPDVIIVDAGTDTAHIKTELERWLNEHPRLDHVRVTLPRKPFWLRRLWRKWLCAAPASPVGRLTALADG